MAALGTYREGEGVAVGGGWGVRARQGVGLTRFRV